MMPNSTPSWSGRDGFRSPTAFGTITKTPGVKIVGSAPPKFNSELGKARIWWTAMKLWMADYNLPKNLWRDQIMEVVTGNAHFMLQDEIDLAQHLDPTS